MPLLVLVDEAPELLLSLLLRAAAGGEHHRGDRDDRRE